MWSIKYFIILIQELFFLFDLLLYILIKVLKTHLSTLMMFAFFCTVCSAHLLCTDLKILHI